MPTPAKFDVSCYGVKTENILVRKTKEVPRDDGSLTRSFKAIRPDGTRLTAFVDDGTPMPKLNHIYSAEVERGADRVIKSASGAETTYQTWTVDFVAELYDATADLAAM